MDNPYPNIPDAYALHELPAGNRVWAQLRRRAPSVDEAIAGMKRGAAHIIRLDRTSEEDVARFKRVLAQMDHPEFRRYVSAKLGYT